MLIDICMKFREDSLSGFQVIERALLISDLVMVKFPREFTHKVSGKRNGYCSMQIF